jgi:phage recombination protein Bet
MSENTAVVVMSDTELTTVLQNSLYPGAKADSIKLVLGYCKAAGLDPMQKPCHIVPLWNSKAGAMQDVVMPGIGLYRVQAARTGEYAGVTEPEFGPDVEEVLGGQVITYPAWCKVTVKRRLRTGEVAEFTAKEFWKENYAAKGGKEKSIAPNAMWAKRPYGQLNKCSEAQALRKAFPELIGAQPTAEEMEGKIIDVSGKIVSNDQGSSELLSKWLQIAESITDEAGLKAAYAEGIKEFKAANDLEGAGSFRKYVTDAGEAIKSLAKKRAEAAIVDVVPEEKKTPAELNADMEADIPFE